MKNLNNKCFATSAVVHLTLFALLLIGVGFRASDSSLEKSSALEGAKASTVQLFDIPEAAEAAHSAASQPSQAQTFTAAVTPPISPRVLTTVANSAKVSTATANRRPLPNVSTVPETPPAQAGTTPLSANPAGASTSRNKVISDAIDEAMGRIANSSSRVKITLAINGGAGRTSYEAFVHDAYARAWSAPEIEPGTASPIACVRVTIARNGTILAAALIKSSDNPSMDASVNRALRTVTRIEAFEADSPDTERTFTINFNLDLHRLE